MAHKIMFFFICTTTEHRENQRKTRGLPQCTLGESAYNPRIFSRYNLAACLPVPYRIPSSFLEYEPAVPVPYIHTEWVCLPGYNFPFPIPQFRFCVQRIYMYLRPLFLGDLALLFSPFQAFPQDTYDKTVFNPSVFFYCFIQFLLKFNPLPFFISL